MKLLILSLVTIFLHPAFAGTGTLTDRTTGQTITSAFFNDIHSALKSDFVGRNSSGVATANQNLGTTTYPWGIGHFGGSADGGRVKFRNPASSGKYNWQIDNAFLTNNELSISPSTATDGDTYSTAVLRISRGNVSITPVDSSSSGELRFMNPSSSGLYNWHIAAGYSTANSFEITPSTATDGATFSAPLFKVTQAGLLTLGASGGGQIHVIHGSSQTTVGAAGGASALPATPLGYLRINVNGGGTVKVPYYND